MSSGSSPLARGLRRCTGAACWCARIIPARAGFTPLRPAPTRWAWDHPRSRGVYQSRRAYYESVGGSSPLARGLPPTRIERRRWPEDHPRSRGVYAHIVPPNPRIMGSSPLARGLLFRGQQSSDGEGIIPARAGFTDGPDDRPRTSWDHPRSRGVYKSNMDGSLRMDGSSPLARGLRSSRIGVCGSCGIIPARAGFTRRKYEPTPPWSDHPRSRGVYNYKTSKHGNKGGSSPLARGLLEA